MEAGSDQLQDEMLVPADLAARSTAAKPRTREVKARYLQPKPAPAAAGPRGGGAAAAMAGRPSLAGYHSTGWVELQLPQAAATPLLGGGSVSAACTSSKAGRRLSHAPQPAAGTAQRRPLPPGHQRGQRPHQQQQGGGTATLQEFRTPAPPSQATTLQQQQQHDVLPLPDNTPRISYGPQGAAATQQQQQQQRGISRQQQQQQQDLAGLLQTPQLARLGASVGCAPATDGHVGRLGMSADMAAALQAVSGRTSDTGAAERRAQLEAYRLQRKLQQQQQQAAGAMSARGGLRGPPPRAPASSTMFTATAAVRSASGDVQQQHAGGASASVSRGSSVSSGAGGGAALTPAAAGTAACGLSIITSHAAGSTAARASSSGSASSASLAAAAAALATAGTSPAVSAGGGSPAPGSAFKATMATLQQTGSGSKPGRPRSSGKPSRPVGVPALSMERLLDAAAAGATPPQRQQQQMPGASPLPPGSCTRIPQLDAASLGAASSSNGGQQVPLTSRHVSRAAHVPLPDGTPRAFQRAPPSRLPRTPRTSTAGGSGPAADEAAAGGSTTAAPPQQQQQQRVSVPGLRLGELAAAAPPPSTAAAAAAAGPPLSSRSYGGGAASRPAGPGGATPRGSLPASSRSERTGAAITPPGAAAPAAVPGRNLAAAARQALAGGAAQHQHELGRPLATPRGWLGTGAAAAGGMTPRLSSNGGAAPPAAAAAVVSKAEQARADEVRQQLRLLRMQHLQLRHLNARMEAALSAKQQKADAAVAAAAAAIIDLSARLAAVTAHAQQQQWQCELGELLERQLPKLRQWAGAQGQHAANLGQLQAACEAALSHVPLLGGATVGGTAEAPDLELLQQRLAQGVALMEELGPAVAKLLGPAAAAEHGSSSSSSEASSGGGVSQQQQQGRGDAAAQHAQRGICATASLAEQLMAVAAEECGLLQQLRQQLGQLSDLHLYANSMQVQLAQMQQLDAGSDGAAV